MHFKMAPSWSHEARKRSNAREYAAGWEERSRVSLSAIALGEYESVIFTGKMLKGL